MFNYSALRRLVSSRNFWLIALAVFAGGFLVVYGFFIVLVALVYGADVNTFAANGTFQLYNPLRRLADGQAPGYDFPFFHGVGVPWLHYPVFTLLGGNLFAAEAAKTLVSPLVFLGSTTLFFYSFFRNTAKTLIATAAFTMAALFCIDIIGAGNSLVGLRGTFPILIAAALLWRTGRTVRLGRITLPFNEVMAVILLGMSLSFSTENGLAAIMAYTVIRAVLLWRAGFKKPALVESAVYLVFMGAALLLTITLLTKGHPIDALRYALVDVPGDQGWYFGAPPATYLTWDNFLPRLFARPILLMWVVILAGLAAVRFVFASKEYDRSRKTVSVFFVLYGTITFGATIFGYYAPIVQLIPLERVMGLLAIAIFTDLLFRKTIQWKKAPRRLFAAWPYITGVAIAILFCLIGYHAVKHIRMANDIPIRAAIKTARIARHQGDYYAASIGWKESLDTFSGQIKPGATIWSTYAGLYESTRGQLHPSKGGEDYIIHALGVDRREKYSEQFIADRPEYVTTLVPTYFVFEEWLWSTSWPFYRQLFTSYDLVAQNASHYLWKLRDEPVSKAGEWKTISPRKGAYVLPAGSTNPVELYEVRVQYRATANMYIKGFDRTPRYLIEPHDISGLRRDITLPSHKTTQTFVIPVLAQDDQPRLTAKVDGIIPWASLDLASVEYRRISVPPTNRLPFFNNRCAAILYKHKNHKACTLDKLKLERFK